jgi:hypothetical protein
MEITPYNHHREGSFRPSVFGPQIKTTGFNRASLLSNQLKPSFCLAPTHPLQNHRYVKWIVTDKRTLPFGMLSSGRVVGKPEVMQNVPREWQPNT